MKISGPPFRCSLQIQPFLQKVFDGEYEVPLWSSNLTIIDIGANFGAFSVWASHRWPGSAVYAYEPHPKTFQALIENTKNYPFIFRHECAIGRDEGFRPLYFGQNNEGEASLRFNSASDGTGIHVEVRSPLTLREADIIKIDAEGVEAEILSTLIEAGRKFRAIMFEYHNTEQRLLIDALLREGYVLTGAAVSANPEIGVCRYINKRELK